MSVWFALALQAGSTGDSPPPRPASRPRALMLPHITASCPDADGAEEIVVCGARPDRYRLPLPLDDADVADKRAPREAASPAAAIAPRGDCGPFAGQRTCSKAEAARYGYGGGRDPAALLVRLGRKLIDPDAELGPPVKVPLPLRR